MATTSKDICDNIQLAREMSLLGNYDEAEVYYEGLLQMISRFLIGIPDQIRKDKWQQVQKKVVTEYEQVKTLKNMLNTLSLNVNHEVPIGVRRDEPVKDGLDFMDYNTPTDPDVWPAPTPADHSARFTILPLFISNVNQIMSY